MDILTTTEKTKQRAIEFGRFRYLSEKSGVGYEWLIKFIRGDIPNPGILNVDKLDKFLRQIEKPRQ